MTVQLNVIMFTDQVDSTSSMAKRLPDEIKQVNREHDLLTAEAAR